MEPPTSSHPPSAPKPAILTTTLASPGRGLVASGPLLVPAPPDLPPIRHDYLVRLPGLEQALNLAVRVDDPSTPVPGPWTVVLPLDDGTILRIKLEA